MVLKKAVAGFPNSTPPRDSEKLRDFMEEREVVFESLSRQFLRAEKDLNTVLISYIQKHENSFQGVM